MPFVRIKNGDPDRSAGGDICRNLQLVSHESDWYSRDLGWPARIDGLIAGQPSLANIGTARWRVAAAIVRIQKAAGLVADVFDVPDR